MHGTTLRIVTAAACVAALAAPGSALAKKHHRRVHKAATLPAVTVKVPHIYDAGGNGMDSFGLNGPINLVNPVNIATSLGNQALGQLGLPPVDTSTLPTVTLPTP